MFGLQPASTYHLLYLLVPLLLWFTTRPAAKKHGITIFHTASLAVSYWEEVLFRGLIFGLMDYIWHNAAAAIIVSSVLFGVFHLRNLWWLEPKKVLVNCLYTGLFFGPLVALVRWWTGDIYLGVAIHAAHNFLNEYMSSKTPTDQFLLSKQANMNRFQQFFSAFWLRRSKKHT